MALDDEKLGAFIGRFVTDLGATMAAGSVVIGHELGLYRALGQDPATADDLATRTGTTPRYVAEWLRGQAAGGYVDYDATTETYSMSEEQSFVLANPDGAIYAPGAFVLALGTLRAVPEITERFRTGTGYGWHQQDNDVFVGTEQFFRPGYIANLVPSWIPALDDVEAKLRAGAVVADLDARGSASCDDFRLRAFHIAEAVHDDIRTFGRQRLRDAQADTAGGTCDERCFTFEHVCFSG